MADATKAPAKDKPNQERLTVQVNPTTKQNIMIAAIKDGHGRNFGAYAQKVFDAGLKALGIG